MTHISDPGPSAPDEPVAAPLGRTISPIAGRLGSGRTGKVITLLALVAGCGVFAAATWRHGKPAPQKVPQEPARQVVNFEPVKSQPAPSLAHPGPDAPMLVSGAQTGTGPQVPAIVGAGPGQSPPPSDPAQNQAQSKAQLRAQALAERAASLQAMRSAPMLIFGGANSLRPGAQTAQSMTPTLRAATPVATELDQLRQGSSIGLAHASRLPNRDFLIVAGASLPCILQTAMDTSTAGFVSCLVPKDVYSDNGSVVLMEKGSKVLGEYRSGLRQGQTRLFVLWTRAVTPAGVAINLGSPASDALGRAGFDGELDTFFWQRFGSALLLSVVDDATTAAAQHGNTGTINNVPSNTASVALQNSINIPPALKKPQGSEVAIFVAQDLDFSEVYGLKAKEP